MAVSGFVRVMIVGSMAVWLTACGGGGDAPDAETPDIAEVIEPEVPPASEPEPVPVKLPQGDVQPAAEAERPAAIPNPPIEPRPPCGGSDTCVHAGSVSGGHGEPGIELYYDSERNDAIVRWGNALGEIMDCADGGETIAACVAVAEVAQSCKDEFDRLTGLANEIAAFDAVFLTTGSPCRPEEGQP